MREIRLHALACVRGEREVFRDVDAHLSAGDALVLQGANGCGKTSLLRILAGLLLPSSGEIRMQDISAPPCYLGHENALKRAMTSKANLLFWQRFLEAEEESLEEGIARFRLQPLLQTPVSYLSLGQRRRLALARLLLTPTPLWLLDEPASGLDEQALDCLGAAMASHRKNGGMVIAASHVSLPLEGAAVLRLDEARYQPNRQPRA